MNQSSNGQQSKGLPADVPVLLTWNQPLELHEAEPWMGHQAGWKVPHMNTPGHQMAQEASTAQLSPGEQWCWCETPVHKFMSSSKIFPSLKAVEGFCSMVSRGGCKRSIQQGNKARTEPTQQQSVPPLQMKPTLPIQPLLGEI